MRARCDLARLDVDVDVDGRPYLKLAPLLKVLGKQTLDVLDPALQAPTVQRPAIAFK